MPIIRAFDDLAQNIANPPPNRPIARGVGNFGRSVCDAVSSNPQLYAPTFLQWPILALCQPYFDGEGFDPPEEAPPPFTGGQCPGVGYVITGNHLTFFSDCSSQPRSFQITAFGPIGGLNSVGGAAPNCPGADSRGYTLTTPNGEVALLGPSADGFSKPTITVAREDGLPDDCGSLPPTLQPGPNPAPDPGPLPPGTGPQFDPRGNPIFVVPPTLDVGDNITLNLGPGEVNLGGGTGNQPALPPLPGEPIPGAGGAGGGGAGGGGDNDFPDPPENERWVGCCVNIISTPVGQGIIVSSQPEAIYPAIVGNVRLKFQGGDAPPAYDTPISNRQRTTCVWEPVRGLAPVGCFVNLLPDFSYTVTPYSVPLEQ